MASARGELTSRGPHLTHRILLEMSSRSGGLWPTFEAMAISEFPLWHDMCKSLFALVIKNSPGRRRAFL